jgi:hypothetical protein
MSFMQPEVVHGQWYEVDGGCGTEYIPADLVGTVTVTSPDGTVVKRPPTVDELRGLDEPEEDEDSVRFPVPTALRDYCQNLTCWSINLIEGWGARLSAPGYLDCTEWTVWDTREEAVESFNSYDEGDDE